MKYIKAFISLTLLAFFLIFSIQNNIIVDFKFLMFKLNQIPLFVVIIIVFVIGFIAGRVTEWFSILLKPTKKKKK